MKVNSRVLYRRPKTGPVNMLVLNLAINTVGLKTFPNA